MSDAPTPRTDAEKRWAMDVNGSNDVVCADFARQLERELAEVQDRIDDLTATGIHSCGDDCKRPNCVLRRKLAEAMNQRDALARIGGKLRNVCPSSCDDYVAEWDKALAALEGRAE